MVYCCRCNGDGKCKNCACVKAGRPCTTCLPARRGHCSNMKQPPASDLAPVQLSTPLRRPPPPTTVSVTAPRRETLSQPTDQPLLPSATTSAVADTAFHATPLLRELTPSDAHLLPPPKAVDFFILQVG